MSVKEMVLQELDTLNENDLWDIVTFLSFLKFRSRQQATTPLPDANTLARLYAEFADEDRLLAEADIIDYNAALLVEDPIRQVFRKANNL